MLVRSAQIDPVTFSGALEQLLSQISALKETVEEVPGLEEKIEMTLAARAVLA